MLKLGKPGKKTFFVKVNINISCEYFSFIVYQRSVQLLYEILDLLIGLTAFAVSLSFADRQTDRTKDQTPKQHC